MVLVFLEMTLLKYVRSLVFATKMMSKMNHEYEYQTFTEDPRKKSGKVWATFWVIEMIKN